MISELRSRTKSSLSHSHSLTMPFMRLSGTKAGSRCEVRSEGIGCTTSRPTAPVRSSQRNSARSDEISRFIEAALTRPVSVR